MKILSLRFENLNSLYGVWSVDFQHPDYTDNGLFAIVGPTGAGKSTLLDAICLSLFGQTPRLKTISKSENEIMSRHCGYCSAEVVFAVGDKTYRSTWSQSRARNKPDGRLQEAKHELADASTGKIIEEKKSRTVAAIEAISHLNFQRFTRSILLAQGSFAAFLQASVDERSDMLQQITGTEIYEHISKQVHHNKRDAESALHTLQAVLEGITLLDDSEIHTLQQSHAEHTTQCETLSSQLGQVREQQQRQLRWQHLQTQHATLRQQWQQHQTQNEQFAEDAKRLEQGLRAQKLGADYRELTLLRQRQHQLSQQQQHLQAALPQLAEQAIATQQQHDVMHAQVKQLLEQHALRQDLWQRIGVLDARINSAHERKQEWQQQHSHLTQQAQQLADKRNKLQSQKDQHQEQLQRVEQQLAVQNMQAAAEQLPKWQEQLLQLERLQLLLAEQSQSIESIAQQSQLNTSAQQDLSRFFGNTEDRQQQLQQQMLQTRTEMERLLAGKTLNELELEREHLKKELTLMQKIVSLEHERQLLQQGAACPLCGSTEHPYVSEHVGNGELNATEARLLALDSLFKSHAECQHNLQQWYNNQSLLQQQYEMKQAEQLRLLTEAKTLAASHDKACAQSQNTVKQISTLTQGWAAFGYQEGDDAPLLLDQLQRRVKHWQRYQQLRQELQDQLHDLEKDLLVATQQNQDTLQQLQQIDLESTVQQQLLQQLHNERHEIFGDASTEQDQQQWRQRVDTAQRQWDGMREQWQHCRDEHQQHSQRLQDTTELWQQSQTALATTEEQWQQALQLHQFVDEASWQSRCLPEVECEALSQQAQRLREEGIQLAHALEHNVQEQARLDTVGLDEAQQLALQTELNTLQAAYQHATQAMGAITQQLHQQQLAQERMAEQAQKIHLQQQECARWRDLHELIGSSDGKKYRLFAQSLTFNQLVQQANRQLQNMSDRYLLKQTDDAPLQLDVIDQYQGGTVRSAKNLSGGESFIVSLALALGLARMASATTRIDSLFLDEGFGTLDEDALDVALNALASLQQEGKLIGVISHVAALKERISTQIKVEPKHNGHSVLHGSGIAHASQ